ncbi:MAG: thioredoxin domain-containing protein [Phycisphaeraceae bacterium]
MRMRNVGVIAAAAMVFAAVGAGYAAQTKEAKRPDVLAVAFHADWCGTCKQIEKPVGETVKHAAGMPMLFVMLDLTDEQTQAQSEMLAGALGLDEVWAEYSKGTGFVLLIDRKTGEVMERLTAKHSAAEMIEVVDAALARAG